MRKKIDKQVRIDSSIYSEFNKLCERNNSKSIKSEANHALKFFIRLGIAPSDYTNEKLESVIERIDNLDRNNTKLYADFKAFTNKSLDRQFGFLKEHEKYNFKKLDEFVKRMSTTNDTALENSTLVAKINTEATWFMYDLFRELAKINLGIYETKDIPDWEDLDTEELNFRLYENFKSQISQMIAYFKKYERNDPDEGPNLED